MLKKRLALVLIIIIIIFTIGAIYFFNQQTTTALTTQTRADTGLAGGQAQVTDSCGFIRLSVSESPSCPRLVTDIDASGKPLAPVTTTNNVAEYSTTFTLTNVSNATRTVKYVKMGFFCDEAYGTATPNGNGGYRPVCIGNPNVITENVTLQPNESKAVVVTTRNATEKACGTFQNDIVYGTFQNDLNIVSVDGNTACSVPTAEQIKAGNVAGWGFCQTGKSFTQCPVVPTTAPTTAPQTCGMVQVRINACTSPTTPPPTKCGSPCDEGDQYPDCEADHVCVESGNGSFCAKRGLETNCQENGNATNCCVNPTNTPIPTYTPLPTYTPVPPPPPIVQQQQQQQQQQQTGTNVITQQGAPQTVQVTTIVQLPAQQIIQQQQTVQQIQPTYTPQPLPPTYTIMPTFSPYPTQPAQPTYTPVPAPPVSGSPLPFILAGIPVILLILGMVL